MTDSKNMAEMYSKLNPEQKRQFQAVAVSMASAQLEIAWKICQMHTTLVRGPELEDIQRRLFRLVGMLAETSGAILSGKIQEKDGKIPVSDGVTFANA